MKFLSAPSPVLAESKAVRDVYEGAVGVRLPGAAPPPAVLSGRPRGIGAPLLPNYYPLVSNPESPVLSRRRGPPYSPLPKYYTLVPNAESQSLSPNPCFDEGTSMPSPTPFSLLLSPESRIPNP